MSTKTWASLLRKEEYKPEETNESTTRTHTDSHSGHSEHTGRNQHSERRGYVGRQSRPRREREPMPERTPEFYEALNKATQIVFSELKMSRDALTDLLCNAVYIPSECRWHNAWGKDMHGLRRLIAQAAAEDEAKKKTKKGGRTERVRVFLDDELTVDDEVFSRDRIYRSRQLKELVFKYYDILVPGLSIDVFTIPRMNKTFLKIQVRDDDNRRLV